MPQVMRRAVTTKAVDQTSEHDQGDPLIPVEQIATILDNSMHLSSVRCALQLQPSLGDPHQWKVRREDTGRFYWEFTSSYAESVKDLELTDSSWEYTMARTELEEVRVFGKSIEEVIENGCADYLAHHPVGVQATALQREEWAGWKSEAASQAQQDHPKQRLTNRSNKYWRLELGSYADHFVCDDPQGSPIDPGGRFLLREYYKLDPMSSGTYKLLYGVLDRMSGKLAVSSSSVDKARKVKETQAMACARALRYLDENRGSSPDWSLRRFGAEILEDEDDGLIIVE
jgi:hypothetical protein